MSLVMQALDDFRSRYDLRPPEFIGSQREAVQLHLNSVLRLLRPAPAMDISIGTPPSSFTDDPTNRYLWVIDERGIPYIIESPNAAIGRKLPKHTNLTGGGDAYLGGEMWFSSTISIYISGGSGRYPPKGECQLEDAARVFNVFGYDVTSLGWNEDTGRAFRVLEAA